MRKLMVSTLVALAALILSLAAVGNASADDPLLNGDFETGALTGWTSFITNIGTIYPTGFFPTVAYSETAGAGDVSLSAQFVVGQAGGISDFQPDVQSGGGIFQSVQLVAGQLTVSVDIATRAGSSFNGSGGLFTLLVNELPVDSHDFLPIDAGSTNRSTLTATVQINNSGSHEIRLSITRPFLPFSGFPTQTVDNFVLSGTATVVATPPQLTVKKQMVNNDGGGAAAGAFTMNVSATNPSSASFAGSEGGTTITLDAGSYSVTESGGPSGYAASLSSDCSGSIALGESKTCTITNDDIAPKLTVTKVVENDNFGFPLAATDFTLFVGLVQVTSAVQNEFSAGTYLVSETAKPGYDGTINGDCAPDGTITLALGEVKACEITNVELGSEAAIRSLILFIDGLYADGRIMGPKAIRRALTAKLDAVVASVQRDKKNKDKTAVNGLNAFTNFLRAQSDRKLVSEDALAMCEAAERTVDAIKHLESPPFTDKCEGLRGV